MPKASQPQFQSPNYQLSPINHQQFQLLIRSTFAPPILSSASVVKKNDNACPKSSPTPSMIVKRRKAPLLPNPSGNRKTKIKIENARALNCFFSHSHAACKLHPSSICVGCQRHPRTSKIVRSHLTEAIENFRAEGPSCYSPGCSESASAGPGAIIPPIHI